MAVEKLKCNLQYALPHHFLSRTIAKIADCRIPFVKNGLIRLFVNSYKVDVTTALREELSEYQNFNEFFTRALKPTARPITPESYAIASPADGKVSQLGAIKEGKLFQAKGHYFKLIELLGGDQDAAKKYQDGQFITIYLAPSDYHRVHMPLDGKLLKTIYVPGQLFSVNQQSVEKIPNLFCRNERLICLFDTEIGEVALIMVGAMLVAGIETVWGQQETPCESADILIKNYEGKNIILKKGDEMGRFKFGSTVILLFPPNKTQLSQLSEQQQINMGSLIGRLTHEASPHGNE